MRTAFLIATLLLASISCQTTRARALNISNRHLEGQIAPEFVSQAWVNAGGNPARDTPYELIVFFRPDCRVCAGEVGRLVDIARIYKDRGLQVIAVTSAAREKVLAFAELRAVNYPILAEATTDLENWGIEMIWGGTFYLVNERGRIVAEGLRECELVLAAELGPGLIELPDFAQLPQPSEG